MNKTLKYLISIIVIILIAFVGYQSFFKSSKAEANTITVGMITGSKQDEKLWNTIAKNAKDQYGLTVKIKNFSDYSQPNKALSNKDTDVNAFQTQAFLDVWNKSNNTDLKTAGKTIIAPMKIYSKKYSRLSQIPNGGTISVPNDTINESRGLKVLESAGLIKLKNDPLATVKSITSNPKNLKIKEVDTSQTPRVLGDVSASTVNSGFALAANLNPKKAIFSEKFDKDAEQYVNIIAARKDNEQDQKVKKLVKVYQSDATKKAIEKIYGENEVPAWNLKFK